MPPSPSSALALRLGLALLPALLSRALAADAHLTVDSATLRLGEAQREHAAALLLVPTPVRLQGRMSLAGCIAALSASGNPTALDAGTDPARTAELHPEGSSYWEAVAAVCRAFALHPVPGATLAPDYERMPAIPVESGPLLLSAATAPAVMLEACGPVLAVIDTFSVDRHYGDHRSLGIDVTARLRLEPHLTQSRLGWCSLRTLQVSDEHGRALQLQPPESPVAQLPGQDPRIQPRGLELYLEPETEPAVLLVSAEMLLQMAEPWRVAATMSAGDTAGIDCIGRTLTLSLVDADHQGPNGTHGPLLTLDYPHEAVESDPHMGVSRGGSEVASRGGGVFDTINGRTLLNALVQLDKDPYQVVVSASSPLGAPQTLPLRLSLPLAGLAAQARAVPEIAQFQPSQVSWPAGRLTINQAIAKLAGGGNRVLLELGADESQQRDLPAFSGSFWEGLMLVGRTYHLAPRSDDDALAGTPARQGGITLGSGPVSLAAQTDGPHQQPAGALLIGLTSLTASEVRSLGGGGHRLQASLRLRLEPRVDEETVGQCFCTLDTFATDDQGRQVTIEEAAPPANAENGGMGNIRINRFRGIGIQAEQAGGAVPAVSDVKFSIDDLGEHCASLTITGQLRVQTQRRIHHELTLLPGGSITVGADEGSLQLELFDQGTAEAAGLSAQGLLVASDNRNLPNSILLFSPTGAALTCIGTERLPRSGLQMLYHFPVTEAGVYRVVIDDLTPLAVVKLPVRTTIDLPHPAGAPAPGPAP